jgi:cytochrome c5
MSDAHNEHESLIKTPRQLIVAVAAAFVVPIIVIILIVQYVASGGTTGASAEAMSPEAIAQRLQPVADAGFTLVDANAPRQLQTGAAVYKAACAACHDTGAAGAPRLGDESAWAARIGQGQATVVSHAINGLRGMPAKGGNPDLDDVEVERAVVYMVNQSGGKFKEPEVKAASPAAADVPAQDQGAPVASATDPLTAAQPSQQVQAVTPAPAETAKVDGKKVYDTACAACHTPGVAGAPKLGDKAAWAPRIKQGADTLYAHAIKGFQGQTGFMPPRGGSSASDEEVMAAVDYMMSAAK